MNSDSRDGSAHDSAKSDRRKERKQRILDYFGKLNEGKQRPEPKPGQIWALTEEAGMPNPVVCLIGKISGNATAALKLAEKGSAQMATDRDLILSEDESDIDMPIMVECWNRLEVHPRFLSHCLGTLPDHVLFEIKRISAAHTQEIITNPAIGRVGLPIRYPGDVRIRFQEQERAFVSTLRVEQERDGEVLQLAATTDTAAGSAISAEESDEFSRMAGVVGILTLDRAGDLHIQRLVYEKGAQPSTEWARNTKQGLNAALTAANLTLEKIKGARAGGHTDFYTVPWGETENMPADIEGRSLTLAASLCILSAGVDLPLPGIIAVGDLEITGKVKSVKLDDLIIKIAGLAKSPALQEIKCFFLPKPNENAVSTELAKYPALARITRYVGTLKEAFDAVSCIPRSVSVSRECEESEVVSVSRSRYDSFWEKIKQQVESAVEESAQTGGPVHVDVTDIKKFGVRGKWNACGKVPPVPGKQDGMAHGRSFQRFFDYLAARLPFRYSINNSGTTLTIEVISKTPS